MKALIIERAGAPDTLKISEQPLPVPAPHEVRVRVMAIGLNPADYQTAEWGFPSWKWPHILGLDVAGTIDAVGNDITTWKTGDRVFYHGDLSQRGGYAEFAVAPAHILAELPEDLMSPSVTSTQDNDIVCRLPLNQNIRSLATL